MRRDEPRGEEIRLKREETRATDAKERNEIRE